jgi:hypothetical protein
MARFNDRLAEDDVNRAYVGVDDVFDISILRIEEGILIEVFDSDEGDLLGTLPISENSLARNREE